LSGERHAARLATVAFVRCGDALLLLRHPAGGDRFPGLWNGVGGHVEAGEGIREAAQRELREEAGLEPADLRLRGVIHEVGLAGHPYVVFVFAGESAGRELAPRRGLELAWHPLSRLGELPLVPDVPLLLDHLFEEGEPVFLVQRFEGGDNPVDLRLDGAPAAAAAASTGSGGAR
jgi:8-oxo-dGTP diphosphatase